jgi:hypothetical protein
MKTTRLISIALITIIALTAVSGAGVLKAAASNGVIPPSISPMAITQDGTAVDTTKPVQLGKQIAIQWTATNQDLTHSFVGGGLSIWGNNPLGSDPHISLNEQFTDSQLIYTVFFTPDKPGMYFWNVTINWWFDTGEQGRQTYFVSVFATPTKDSIVYDLTHLRDAMNGFWSSDFYLYPNANIKSALVAVIDAARLQAKNGKYGDAAYTLQSKFITRTDGCALRGSVDMTGTIDFIRPCDAQAPIYLMANTIVQELQWLQAHPS